MSIPPKITLKGDKNYARNFIGAAQSQLRILENQMSFQKLKQGARRVRLGPRTIATALVCFNLSEVIIDCLPVKGGGVKKRKQTALIPRFFAYVVRVDANTGVQTEEYYWIYFNNKDDSVSMSAEEKNWSKLDINDTYEFLIRKTKNSKLEVMNNTPKGVHLFEHPHKHTKAFMVDDRSTEIVDAAVAADEDLKPQRYVSACHLLTKDREPVFMPLHSSGSSLRYGIAVVDDICETPDISKYPSYPLPWSGTLFASYDDILFTGLSFPLPPRHFYCNIEEGVMAWYSTNSDYGTDAYNFIGGIIYNIRDQTFKNFLIYPSEADGQGYETCYALYYGNSELPQNLMADIQSLDRDAMVVAMSWNKRPIEYTYTFGGALTTAEITACTHTRWTGGGFEHQPLTVWTQFDIDPAQVVYTESDGPFYFTWDTAPCGPRVDGACSGFIGGDVARYDEGSRYSANDSRWRHSDQTWDLLGTNVSLVADVRTSSAQQTAHNKMATCSTNLGGPDIYQCGIKIRFYTKYRNLQEILFQQGSDDYRGRWVCNNALDFKYRKERLYMDAEAWTHAQSRMDSGVLGGYFPQCYGNSCDGGYVPTEEDFDNRSIWANHCPPDYIDRSDFHYPSFYTVDGDEMKGADWLQIDTDIIHYVGWNTWWEWLRESDQDTYDYTVIDKFNIDGELEFSYDDVDHIYYLDDRATDDNQGLIAAGKGDSVTELYDDLCTGATEYKPDFWKIYWKICWNDEDAGIICDDIEDEDVEYLDITEKLLEALGCEDTELIDLGLI